MTQGFNVEEILEIACQIERNGAAFYNKAATLVTDAAAQKTLRELADMEDGHETTFERMMDDRNATDQLFSDPDGLAANYLRAIASNHVFVATANPLDRITSDTSEKDVLLVALQAEFSSIAFFQGMLESLPPHFDRDKLREVIEEEKQHVVIINRKLETLK